MTVPPSTSIATGRAGRVSANGATVRALRIARDIHQDKLAEASTLSHSYLSRIETGKRHLESAKAGDLAAALGVPVEVLTGQRPAISFLRAAQGITERQFANDIGVTTMQLRRLEQGSELPNPNLLRVIANRLGVDPAAIRPIVDEGAS